MTVERNFEWTNTDGDASSQSVRGDIDLKSMDKKNENSKESPVT